MPTRSGYFNNPAFAQAASNLAGLFAPPSGADAAGWAMANAKRDEAARLAQLYAAGATPSEQAALTGVQSYGATPQGFNYKVDQDNSTQRYGYDTQAATLRSNNMLDNQTRVIGDLFRPLNPDQVRPAVPDDLMQILQMPGVGPTQGAPGRMSETEVKALILQGLDPSLQEAAAFGNTPVETIQTPEGNRFATRLDSIGQAPAPSSSGTPRGYMTPDGRRGTTLDGITDAASGEALPQGTMPVSTQGTPEQTGLTTSTRGNVEKSEIAAQKFQNLLGLTRQLSDDPTNFGVPGFVKGTLQDVAALANGMSSALGFSSAEEALTNAQVEMVRNGVDPNLLPGVFDPNLAALQTTSDLLVYQAAAALAGQSGRDVSDKDVQMFKGIVGDPRAWTATPERFNAKLDQMERILNAMREVDQGALGGSPAPVGAQPVGAAPPAQAAPAPSTPAAERWERGPDGSLRRVQ